jgi:hypothetical protein
MLTQAESLLDLDMVAQTIHDKGGRSLLLKATQCGQRGSQGVSVLLNWFATTYRLTRHVFEQTAEGKAQKQSRQSQRKQA